MMNGVMRDRNDADKADVGTIVAVMGLQILDILAGGIDIQDSLPRIRSLILTNSNGIAIEICRVHTEAEAVNAVATVFIGIVINIFAIRI